MRSHLLRPRASLLAAALVLPLAACGGGDGPTPPDGGGPQVIEPAVLPVLGLGAVSDRYTAEVWVRGNYAYTSSWAQRNGNVGNTFRVWDVSAAVPRELRAVAVPNATTTGDIQVSDDGRLLVVATERVGGSIAIYDVTAPENPTLITQYSTPSTADGVHTAEVARVNGTLYAFLSVDPGSAPARLVIVDLSNPAAPREVFVRTMGSPFVHDVFVRDGVLFTALWNGGLTIWDIGGAGRGGTPANPVQLGNVRTTGGEVHNVYWLHDPVTGSKRYAFVGQEGPAELFSRSAGDIHVVDVSDFAAPREVAFFRVANAGTHNFSVDEPRGVLYAAYYNGGVRALDVRGDLGSCTAAQRASDGRCDLTLMGRELARGLTEGGAYVWGVHYASGALYASDMQRGLFKLGIVNR